MSVIDEGFAKELNESDWMGTVYEAGFGIPFQYHYLNIPGASKTIFTTECRYHKAFQPVLLKEDGKTFQRSVSNQMVESISEKALEHVASTLNEEGIYPPPLFSLTVSGAHSDASYRGASHGWVNLGVMVEGVIKHYSFHFFNHKETTEEYGTYFGDYDLDRGTYQHMVTRKEAGDDLCRFIQWFMKMVLFKHWSQWGWAIDNMPRSKAVRIDVIRAEDLTIEDGLRLVKSDTPVVYHNGEFKRPVDYFRKHQQVYRGSFDPPTKTHVEIGEGALFEISMSNARKGDLSVWDVAARVEMLSTLNCPVLITKDKPLFADLDEMLIDRGGRCFTYLIGVDTFNAVVADKFNPNESVLQRFYEPGPHGTSNFLVVPRVGLSVTNNERSVRLTWESFNPIKDNTQSSTQARAGNLSIVPDEIHKMVIKKYGIKVD